MNTAVPPFAARLARVSSALQLLALHPDGLPLGELAAQLGADPSSVRDELLAFYAADVGPPELGGLLRSPVLEFLGPEGEEADPNRAEIVRVVDARPTSELGMQVLDAAELAAVYDAGRHLLSLEPDNAALAGALAVLEHTALEGIAPERGSRSADLAAELRRAARERQRVRIVYARAWHPGVRERVIEPYRVVGTRRGWEVDAGPPDQAGAIRSYLVSGILDCRLLDERFEPPREVDELIAANRREQPVELVLPQDRLWVATRYAERVEVRSQDEESVSVLAWLLPPVAQRVGLLVVVAGADAFVVAPPELRDADRDVARQLLRHHRA